MRRLGPGKAQIAPSTIIKAQQPGLSTTGTGWMSYPAPLQATATAAVWRAWSDAEREAVWLVAGCRLAVGRWLARETYRRRKE